MPIVMELRRKYGITSMSDIKKFNLDNVRKYISDNDKHEGNIKWSDFAFRAEANRVNIDSFCNLMYQFENKLDKYCYTIGELADLLMMYGNETDFEWANIVLQCLVECGVTSILIYRCSKEHTDEHIKYIDDPFIGDGKGRSNQSDSEVQETNSESAHTDGSEQGIKLPE